MTWLAQAAPWLALLAIWPLLYALSLLLTALNYRRVRLRAAALSPISREALEPGARTVLDAMRPELEALGFTWRASLRGDLPLVMQPQCTMDSDLYAHASGRAWAIAHPCGNGHGRAFGSVEWMTCFGDGHNWMGLNGQAHDDLAAPPGWTYLDSLQPDTAAAWHAYAQRLESATAPVVADQDEVLRRLVALRQGTAAGLAAQGRARPAGEGQYRLTWPEALRMAWRAVRGHRWQARAAARAAPAQAAAPVRQASEALGFAQQEALRAALHATHGRRHTFWITAVLFLAVGTALFSWSFAWMLLLVIALHEGGHWLAMRWAGYQRQSVFFIPGLGGMATGEKADATPLQKVLVFLAGPMPGVLLAVGVLAAAGWGALALPPPWAMQLLGLCLLVNYFNLLPLTPLDGGRVVETLLFARLPVLRMVFALAGIAALAAMAWVLRDPITVTLVGVLAFGLPWHWRLMRLERAVHRAHPGAAPLDATAATHRLFSVLQQPAFARWPYAQRVAAVRGLLPARQSRPPGWAEGVGGLLIYLACLALPLGALVAIQGKAPQGRQALSALWRSAGTEGDGGYDPGKSMQPIETRLAQALQAPGAGQVAAHLDAAEEMGMLDDHPPAAERARQLYQAAWTLAQSRPPHDAQRAQARLGMADYAESPAQAAQWRQALLADLQGAQGPARLMLARTQEALAYQPPPGQTRAQRLALVRQAVENRRTESSLEDHELLRSREWLASLLDHSGHADAARAQLEANLAALRASTAATWPNARGEWWQALQRIEAENLYAWFLVDHGQARTAVPLARATAAQAATALGHESPWLIDQSLRTWLWAAIESSDAAEVRAALEQQRLHRSTPKARRPGHRDALDQLAAAHLLGDAALRQQALATLQCPQGLPPRQASDLHNDWQSRARKRQQAALDAEGACAKELSKQ